jgi:DNA-binding XRE family transcriptional regulator
MREPAVRDRLSGHLVRNIRRSMKLEPLEFALLFGVTVRTVQLWETGVVVPSVLTSMVIQAEADKHHRSARPARVSAVARRTARTPRVAERARRARTSP